MSKFVPYAAFADLFPIKPVPTRLQVISWAKQGIFPKFWRPAGNRKAEPLFSLDEIHRWLEEAYAPFFATERKGNAKRRTQNK